MQRIMNLEKRKQSIFGDGRKIILKKLEHKKEETITEEKKGKGEKEMIETRCMQTGAIIKYIMEEEE